MKFPEIPHGLITTLDKQFADRCPREDPGAFGLGRLAGQQEVIDVLRHHYERQQERTHVHT